jgi:hypothetical protein
MRVSLCDTGVSYYLGIQRGRRLLAIDWWYDRTMRKRWWLPLQVRRLHVYGRAA